MLLAAILFPVFAQVQAKARTTTCASNLKQIGIAVHMYAQDYDQKYLPTASTAALSPRTRLEPYIKNNQIWLCPDETNATALRGTDARYVTYQFNIQVESKTESSFTRASELVITHDSDPSESGWTEGNTTDGGDTTDWPQFRTGLCTITPGTTTMSPCGKESYLRDEFVMHNGMFNALFVDGHVKISQAQRFTDANFIP